MIILIKKETFLWQFLTKLSYFAEPTEIYQEHNGGYGPSERVAETDGFNIRIKGHRNKNPQNPQQTYPQGGHNHVAIKLLTDYIRSLLTK